MDIKDFKLLKTLLLQYKSYSNDGWTRYDINMVLEKLSQDIEKKIESTLKS